MNHRIESIFRQARQTLGDKDKDRWSDQDLLDLLDLGHKDYAHHAQMLRGEAVIPIVPGQTIYRLPSDVFILLRAEHDNCKLRISSYDEMDELARISALSSTRTPWRGSQPNSDFNSDFVYACWQEDEGPDPEAIIVDKSNLDQFRMYPIITQEEDVIANYTFSNESGIELPFVGAELFGLVTALDDYTFNSPYGVVTDMYDPFIEAERFDQVEGVVTGMVETIGSLTIRYIKTPDDLLTTNDEIRTPKAFDTGLKYYIVGHALRNDLDVRNVERGNQELAYYQRELDNATSIVEKNAARHTDRVTTYRSGFL